MAETEDIYSDKEWILRELLILIKHSQSQNITSIYFI